MNARFALVCDCPRVLALTAGCSESKLRTGHCERDADCPGGAVLRPRRGGDVHLCGVGRRSARRRRVGGRAGMHEERSNARPRSRSATRRRAGACDSARAEDGAACASRDSGRPLCGPSGACVECVSPTSADCTANPAKPICDAASNTCVGCASDDQCVAKGVGPGICMSHQDGRCASRQRGPLRREQGRVRLERADTPRPVARRRRSAGRRSPLDALTATRRVLLISGRSRWLQWSAAGANPVSIIGGMDAAIVGGLQVGHRRLRSRRTVRS